MKIVMTILMIQGVLLDLLVWRYREYAKYIIYNELIYFLFSNLVPYEHDAMIKIGFICFIFLCYTDDAIPNIVACIIVILIILMVEMPIVLD